MIPRSWFMNPLILPHSILHIPHSIFHLIIHPSLFFRSYLYLHLQFAKWTASSSLRIMEQHVQPLLEPLYFLTCKISTMETTNSWQTGLIHMWKAYFDDTVLVGPRWKLSIGLITSCRLIPKAFTFYCYVASRTAVKRSANQHLA